MARCVDADLLAVTYMEAAKEVGAEELEFLTPEDVARTILKCADSCEEIAPVVHAHWIEEEDCSVITDIPWSMCSACGSYSPKLPYCAFCSAKMDESVPISKAVMCEQAKSICDRDCENCAWNEEA